MKYEFDLPAEDDLEAFADLLWTANDTKEAYQALLRQAAELVKSQFIELFGDPATNTKGWVVKHLPDISENLDNRRIPITSGSRKAGQYPYYGASGIVDYVEEYIFDEDLLLISEDGANLLARVTPIAFPSSGKVWVNNHAHVVRFSSAFTQCYVEYLLNMIDISHYVTGTAQPKLNQAKLNTIPIPDSPIELQKQFAAIVKQSDKSKFELKQNIENINALMKSLMQQDFS
jgi:restriction endonuclease S subunit